MDVRRFVIVLLGCLCATAPARAASDVVTATGSSPKKIQPALDTFRDRLGALQRVTWDDVPDALADPAVLPTDFYASRGLIVAATSGDQRVSMDTGHPRFSELQSSYSNQFKAFSPDRIFAPFRAPVTDFTFRAPDGAAGYTNGFGVILTDVDTPGSRVVYFTPDGESLGSFDVPASAGAGTLSFIGVSFDDGERVGRVRVISGAGEIGDVDAPDADVVALDDVDYGTPRATPPTPTLRFAADHVDAAERNGSVLLTVTRTGDLDRVSRLRVTPENGTAVSGADFTTTGDTLVFQRGAAQATAVIKLVRDTDVEPPESFSVELKPVLGAVIGEPSRITVAVAADRPGSATGAGGSPLVPVLPVVTLRAVRRVRYRRLLRRGLRVTLHSDRAAFAELSLSRGRVRVLKRTVKLEAGRRKRVRLRFRRKSRRVMRHTIGAVNLLAVVTDAKNGTKVTATRPVKLLMR